MQPKARQLFTLLALGTGLALVILAGASTSPISEADSIPVDATPVLGTLHISPIAPPANVIISGPTEGFPHKPYTFTAQVNPASLPLITFIWEATANDPHIHLNTPSTTDSVSLSWDRPGTVVITITAANSSGIVTNTHLFTVQGIYLPVVLRAY